MRTIIILVFGLFCAGLVQAQVGSSISADGTAPNDNAMLDVQSPSTGAGKGILIPRVTLAQRTTANASLAGGLLDGSGNLRGGAAQGLIVYQTDGSQGLYFNTSQTATPAWMQLSEDANGVSVGHEANGGLYGTVVGREANGYYYGATLGYWANGYYSGAALGYWAKGTNYGAAVGDSANGNNRGAAVGYLAKGYDFGAAVGILADGNNYGAALGYGAYGSVYGAAVGYYAAGANYGAAVGYQANGSDSGAAVGRSANGYNLGAALGYEANGSSGVAVGRQANGSSSGTAVGLNANGYYVGTAVGYAAKGTNLGVAMGYLADGAQTNVAIGMSANAGGGTERIAIGHNVTNTVNNSTRIRGNLYLDGGTNIYTNGTFGSATWGIKAFMIDHPLDPENKVLRHFCLEGPEVWNVYAGNARLVNGFAVVELPDYYEALNLVGSEIYSLTVVGALAQIAVGKEVNENRFTIIGDKDVKVSWTIKVLRNDPACWEDLQRRPVEQMKSEIR